MDIEVLIPLLFTIPFTIFIVVLVVVRIKGLHQNVAGMLNNHQIQISTGYGYARLMVDGNIIDEVNSLGFYTLKLQGRVESFDIVVNIGRGFCRLRITTFINGVKQDVLCN